MTRPTFDQIYLAQLVAKKNYHASAHSKEMFSLAGVELIVVGE